MEEEVDGGGKMRQSRKETGRAQGKARGKERRSWWKWKLKGRS